MLTRKSSFALLASLGAASVAGSASAHVSLLTPNGGEVVTFGEVLTIRWQIAIPHVLENWDLWYSTESRDGEWIEIAMDLEAGNDNFGSIHTYDWVVPDIYDEDVWVRVRMDNENDDYYDISGQSFSIVPSPGVLSVFALGPVWAGRRRRI